MSIVAFLLRVLCKLNPRILVLVTHKFDILWNECTVCDWDSLVPSLVINLRKCVCVTNELTSRPFCKLTIIPSEISKLVVLKSILKRS